MPAIGAFASYADPEIQLCKSKLGSTVSESGDAVATLTIGNDVAIGDVIVVHIVANSLTATTPLLVSGAGGSVTDTKANVYTLGQRLQGATATPRSGIMVAEAWVLVPSGKGLVRGDAITVNFGASTPYAVYAESYFSQNMTPFGTPTVNSGLSTASTVSKATGFNGGVINTVGWQTRQPLTGDADTLGGNWTTLSTFRNSETGVDNQCLTVGGQAKKATSTTQVWDVTGPSANWAVIAATFQTPP